MINVSISARDKDYGQAMTILVCYKAVGFMENPPIFMAINHTYDRQRFTMAKAHGVYRT